MDGRISSVPEQGVGAHTPPRRACSTYNGSPAQHGLGSFCTPPNYESVKDDVGNQVECGKMGRGLLSYTCECAASSACMQFGALSGSSERGKACTTTSNRRGFNKVVWNKAKGVATIECSESVRQRHLRLRVARPLPP